MYRTRPVSRTAIAVLCVISHVSGVLTLAVLMMITLPDTAVQAPGASLAQAVPAVPALGDEEATLILERIDAARREAETLQRRNAELSERIAAGFVQHRRVVVTEARTAYALLEPKLKMSVDELSDHSVLVRFGSRTERFWVAQRHDFTFGALSCYLLLDSTDRVAAVFEFGCEPEGAASRPGATVQIGAPLEL